MTYIELWTDGSSTGKVGPGGWAYILRYGEREKVAQGYAEDTTNQRMEMTAMLMGMRAIRKPMQQVIVHTDSAYLMNAFTNGWLKKWKKDGWYTGRGTKRRPVSNRDIWEALMEVTANHSVRFVKVKGHHPEGISPLNDRVDALAVQARKDPSMLVTVELPLVENLELTLV